MFAFCTATALAETASFPAGVIAVVTLLVSTADAQRFGMKSQARRLAQTAAPAPSFSSDESGQACPAEHYIRSGRTNQSIFDQLTVDEYNSVVDFMVSSS